MSGNPSAASGRLEFQRQNLWVGLFVIATTIAFVLVAAFAVQERVFRREYRLTSSFPGIAGLKPGAEVFLRGFAVGRVTRIELSTDPDVRFDVEFTVRDAVKLIAGTRVRLSTRGFGSKVLDLVTPGDPSDPEAPPMPPPGRPVSYLEAGASVPGTSGSDLDALMSDGLALTRRITTTMQHLDRLLSEDLGPKLSTTLGTVNAKLESLTGEMQSTLKEAQSVLRQADATMAEDRPRVTKLLDSASKEIDALDGVTRRSDDVIAGFQSRVEPLLDQFAATLAEVNGITKTLSTSLNEEDLKATVAHLKAISEKGDLLVTDLQKHPWRLLRRVKGEKADLIEQLEAERKAREAPPPAP